MSEDRPEYLTDALEMMKHPSIEIVQETTVIQRRAGKMESYDRPAFVKISTSFKQELPLISGDALKVWFFIALSINRNTGKANPGLRTIAQGVKLAVNTVQKALQELETLDLLLVDRETKRYNIYETPEYVSANRAEPTVSSGDTQVQSVSNSDESVSNSLQSVSPSVILNQKNQSKPDIVDSFLAMANFPGAKREARIASIQSYFGERFRINAESKKWRDFARYVDDRQQNFGEDVKVFVSWLYGQKGFDLAFWPPSKMQEFWPSAFVVLEDKSREDGKSSGYYA